MFMNYQCNIWVPGTAEVTLVPCHSIAGEGLEVVEHLKNAGGVVVPTRLQHFIILGGIYADTPAQRKLSKWLGHSAYLGCGHCMLLGTVGPNGHGMYFQGYTEMRAAGICSVCPVTVLVQPPVAKFAVCNPCASFAQVIQRPVLHCSSAKDWVCCVGPGPFWSAIGDLSQGGYWQKDFCGAERIKLANDAQWARARAAEEGTPARDIGAHGISPVLKHLDYADYNNIWIIPMSHALIYGVVKLFWQLLLTGPSAGEGFVPNMRGSWAIGHDYWL